MATQIVKLFGESIVAEQTEKGTYVVRKGEKRLSPYEYCYFWGMGPRCYALKRYDYRWVDLLFLNSRMFFSADYAYTIGSLDPDNRDRRLIAVILTYGTLVIDDWMDVRLFVPGYPRIELVEEKFLVVYMSNNPGPDVRVYNLVGELLSEGDLWVAIEDARVKKGK